MAPPMHWLLLVAIGAASSGATAPTALTSRGSASAAAPTAAAVAGNASTASCHLNRCAAPPRHGVPPPRKTDDSLARADALLVMQHKVSSTALKYAVQSRVYPEEPERLVVTTRGAGLAIFNLSDAGRPALHAQWGANHSLEGQDRVGDTLVVVDLNLSGLHVFNMSGAAREHAPSPVGYVQFGLHGALHCRLYKAPDGNLFALVSIGHGIKNPCRLAVVNVTQPDAPKLVVDFQTPVTCMEGVLVYGEYAFVGGYCDSHSLVVISLADIAAPRIVRALHNSSYVNMVGALGASPAGAPLMYQALWAKPGGVAIFDMQDPASPLEIGRVVGNSTCFANRVQLSDGGGYALLPLEAGLAASGIAAIDVRDPRRPVLAQAVPLPKTKVYCLATRGMFVYAFGIEKDDETSMFVFSISPAFAVGADTR